MRELSHLVNSSSVARAHLHSNRERSPSPPPIAAPSRGILMSTTVTGAPHASPARKSVTYDDDLKSSPSRPHTHSHRRSSRSPSVSRSRVDELPPNSRSTIGSLRTFLGTPPQVGIRLRHESTPSEPNASLNRRPHRRLDIDTDEDTTSGDEVLDSPTGRHTIFTEIPTAAVKSASPMRPNSTRPSIATTESNVTSQRFDRSLRQLDL